MYVCMSMKVIPAITMTACADTVRFEDNTLKAAILWADRNYLAPVQVSERVGDQITVCNTLEIPNFLQAVFFFLT